MFVTIINNFGNQYLPNIIFIFLYYAKENFFKLNENFRFFLFFNVIQSI